jgi:hypothetical protein
MVTVPPVTAIGTSSTIVMLLILVMVKVGVPSSGSRSLPVSWPAVKLSGVLPTQLPSESSLAIGPILNEPESMVRPFSLSVSSTLVASSGPVLVMMMVWMKVSPGSATVSPSASLRKVRERATETEATIFWDSPEGRRPAAPPYRHESAHARSLEQKVAGA